MIEIEVALAKMGKHTTGESGDTVEMIERPGSGFSFVLADGEGSGRGAKTLSNLIVARAIAMLKDGLNDEAVAQDVHNYLYNYRQGRVGVSLDILSVDLAARRMQVVRNNNCPFYVLDEHGLHIHNEPSTPIGLSTTARSQVIDIPVQPHTYLLLFTQGLLHCGSRYSEDMELDNYLANWPATAGHTAEQLAEDLLRRALELDRGQPVDDITILVLGILPRDSESKVRRLRVRFPLDPA